MDGALSGSNSWAANPVSIWTFDGKPVGRRAVGITEEGDLVIFVSNRFTNSYNSVKRLGMSLVMALLYGKLLWHCRKWVVRMPLCLVRTIIVLLLFGMIVEGCL